MTSQTGAPARSSGIESRTASRVTPYGQSISSASSDGPRAIRALRSIGRYSPSREPEPVDGVLCGVEDQHLVDLVGGVEGELLPGLIARGDDLHDYRGGVQPDTLGAGAMQTAVGNAEVVDGIAEVELVHRRLQLGLAGRERRGSRRAAGPARACPKFGAGTMCRHPPIPRRDDPRPEIRRCSLSASSS